MKLIDVADIEKRVQDVAGHGLCTFINAYERLRKEYAPGNAMALNFLTSDEIIIKKTRADQIMQQDLR